MLSHINTFLWKHEKKIKNLILILALIGGFWAVSSWKNSIVGASVALMILYAILFFPISSRVFGIKIFGTLLKFREELGILIGILSLAHLYHMLPMIGFYLSKNPLLVIFGILPQIIILILTLTSNEFSRKKLGKNWKKLHRLAYIVPILIMIQIGLAKNWAIWVLAILNIIFIIGKILEFSGKKFYKMEMQNFPKGQKFLCVPCGFIYNPAIGDPDGGIAPGTEFSDIPDDWRCPECGVTKADFLPYEEWQQNAWHIVKIIDKKYLNSTTIELTIEKPENLTAKNGQFATFEYNDENSVFRRQYSVAKQTKNSATFLIKIKSNGRGGKILTEKKSGDEMNLIGFFGDFILQENTNPKIFIATGTGLAPIFKMMSAIPDIPKKLYFSVSTAEEIFYQDELVQIPNLQNFSYISREKVDGYREGRMKFEDIEAPENAEFYLCGNPQMVENFVTEIKKAGFKSVYFEQFS